MAVELLWWLAPAALLAGLVRGFTGFGTAMVYLPVAGQVLEPFAAITTLLLMDLAGPLPGVPGAWRAARIPDLRRLGIGLVIGLPAGVALLTLASPDVFRFTVSIVSLVLLALLVAGVRYRGQLTPPKIIGTGILSGLLGGVAGIAGPPVILFYMASPLPAAVIRANTLLYLLLTDMALIVVFWGSGNLASPAILTGVLLTLPNALGNAIGGRLFDPERPRLYRMAGYIVIAGSALSGLPIWT
ncbi:sulfite exporter TauE/SafE family protein [Roseisalinus antarcticus]|uniref:Probable membrane transporter protein n=1 Tax=Roseisalinus antarcticus TaxID=254357 RepID=A0A1Y5T4J8_9RHOB|nr:sulfite exporter TauE/SafE family protein [Roseisalinus antarcticus]SLN55085.1 Sulfite exporter TauE/SafE [Roseisalinus antarcticus]